MKAIRCAIVLTLLALSARGDDWTHLGRDDGRERESAERVLAPAVLMTVATGSESIASPVAADGILVLAGTDGKVRAFRENDYGALWSVSTGSAIIATPVLHLGRVYVPGIDGQLRILRLADGASLGAVAVGGSGHSSPLISGGKIHFATAFPNPVLGAIDADSAATTWSASLDQVTYSSPALGGGLVVISTNNGTLAAFDAATGAPAWSTLIGGSPGPSAPLILGSSVFLMVDGTLARLDLATGAPTGTVALTEAPPADVLSSEWACSSLSLADGMLTGAVRIDYALDHTFDGYVDVWTMHEYAFSVDPATLTVNWQVSMGSKVDVGLNEIPPYRIMPAPVRVGNDIAFASSLDADLRLLTAGGAGSTTFTLDAASQASPVVANARLYALSKTGTLHVFEDPASPQPAAAIGLTPSGAHLSASPATLTWAAAPAGSAYTVRLSHDGEFLMDWDVENTGAASSLPCPVLPADHLYTWGVRVRDSNGAFAPWTSAQFAIGSPPQPASGLTATPKHARVVLTWTASPSPDVASYTVAHAITGNAMGAPVDVGNVVTAAVDNLVIGTNYTFEVAAVNTLGFVSIPVTVTATPVATVSIGGTLYSSISAALAAANAGDTVQLAADAYFIAATLNVPAGVFLKGVNGRDTRIQATAGVPMIDVATGAAVDHLGLSGGSIGIIVTGQSVVISNCVIVGMTDAGVDVPGIGNIISNTIVDNAVAGVRAAGRAHARNNIVQGSGVGFTGTVLSDYNDVVDGYAGCTPGPSDLHGAVTFIDPAAWDYREAAGQVSLDSGSPADDFSNEPANNGWRINMGAFGNTPLAATTPEQDKSDPDSSCGLLGLEALLLIGLAALRRR